MRGAYVVEKGCQKKVLKRGDEERAFSVLELRLCKGFQAVGIAIGGVVLRRRSRCFSREDERRRQNKKSIGLDVKTWSNSGLSLV